MDKITVIKDWPQPASVPEPLVFATDLKLVIRYTTSDGAVAIITFPLTKVFRFGSPNDEALTGHPLYRSGLKFYSVHRVSESSWIQELERQNSIHPNHDPKRFMEDTVHYVFTFQDSTLECVVKEGEHWRPRIDICSLDDANRIWKEKISV